MKKRMWVVAAVLAVSGVSATPTELARAALRDQALNLSDQMWRVTSFGDSRLTGIAYSATGWDIDPVDAGCTCRFSAVLTEFDEEGNPMPGTSVTVTNGLTGRGTFSWDISNGYRRRVYKLVHEVIKGGSADASKTLNAYFSLTECTDIQDTYEDIYAGATGNTEKMLLINDEKRPWHAIGRTGDGICTGNVPSGETSSFSFVTDRPGTFTYEYAVNGGAAIVMVDGIEVGTLAASANWTVGTALRLSDSLLTGHTVTFVFTCTTEGGSLCLKNAALTMDKVASFALARGGEARMIVIPTNGWYIAKRRDEIADFVYSCTNWTGCVGATAESDVCIETVALTSESVGEAATNLWNWLEAGIPVTRVFNGEGAYRWKGASGVWKAKMAIVTGNKTNHTEAAIFDLRDFRPLGLVFTLR